MLETIEIIAFDFEFLLLQNTFLRGANTFSYFTARVILISRMKQAAVEHFSICTFDLEKILHLMLFLMKP